MEISRYPQGKTCPMWDECGREKVDFSFISAALWIGTHRWSNQ